MTATRVPSRLLVLLAMVSFAVLLLANAVSGAADPTIITHRVQPGETLWSIAISYGDEGDDPRRLVDEIASHNAVRIGGIEPGQILEVPIN